jgi:hypothetical protein
MPICIGLENNYLGVFGFFITSLIGKIIPAGGIAGVKHNFQLPVYVSGIELSNILVKSNTNPYDAVYT